MLFPGCLLPASRCGRERRPPGPRRADRLAASTCPAARSGGSTPPGVTTLYAGPLQPEEGGSNGSGETQTALFNEPLGVALGSDCSIYLTDIFASVWKIDAQGNGTQIARLPTGGFFAAGLALDAAGNLYVADPFSNRIDKIDPKGNLTTLAGNITLTPQNGGFADGTGGPMGRLSSTTLSASLLTPLVTPMSATGEALVGGTLGASGTAEFDAPDGVAVDANGDVSTSRTGATIASA